MEFRYKMIKFIKEGSFLLKPSSSWTTSYLTSYRYIFFVMKVVKHVQERFMFGEKLLFTMILNNIQ